MKRAIQAALLACIIFNLTTYLSAEPWQIDVNANLTTALNSYSDNWSGGEAGSFTWGSQFLGTAQRQLSKTLNTKTTLKLQFGQTSIQDKSSKNWSVPEKSTDLIDAEELLRYITDAWVDPFASIRVISQFLDGSDSLLVRYGNPIDITEAIGASRTLRKSETIDWATRIGGAARQLVDRKKLDPATGNRKTDMTYDGGVEFNMDLNATNKAKWITLLSSLRIYEALISSKADAAKGTARNSKYSEVK